MMLTVREEPTKMDFSTFKARVVALVNELDRTGNRAQTQYCGPDSEVDKLSKTTKQFWRAKIEISGPIAEHEVKALQEKVMRDEAIQAKQGIISRKKF
ncbi:MAG: hypothetical protein V1820_05905 [archaeon]